MVVVVIIEQHMAYAKTQYQYVKLSTGAMVGVLYGGHGQGRQITPYDISKTQYQHVKLSMGAMVMAIAMTLPRPNTNMWN